MVSYFYILADIIFIIFSAFADILFTNTHYVLSVESYHDQLPIGLYYNLLTYLLLR